MKCEEFMQMLDAYIDGALDGGKRVEMENHAAECASCKEEMDAAVQLSRMLADLDEEVSVPLEAQAAWRKAVRAEAKLPRNRLNGWVRSLGTVAAALVVLVVGTYGMRMDQPTASERQPETLPVGVMTSALEGDTESDGYVWQRTNTPVVGSFLQSDGEVTDAPGAGTGMRTADAPVMLRSAERSIRSDSYDSDFLWLEDLVSEYDAYFEERTVTAAPEDGSMGRVANAVLRVPSDRLDDFLTELDQLGRTVLRSEYNEEVTGRYADALSQLNALNAQKAKLNEMLENAADLEELIAIDDRLTGVTASLESLEGKIRRLESSQSYSRVALTLTEAPEILTETPANLGDRMKQGFIESVEWLKQFGEDALVTAASMLPRLVVWIPAAVLIAVIVCAIRAGRRRNK